MTVLKIALFLCLGVMVVLVSIAPSVAQKRLGRSDGPAPTHANLVYADGQRCRMDLWKAESDSPTPLLIFFHGGAFKMGDKSRIHQHISVNDYLAKGVSCASVNYPFLDKTGKNYLGILKVCEEAVGFVAENAEDWNVDPGKIASSGVSAGALITEWVGCHTEHLSALGAISQPMGTDKMVVPFVHKGVPPLFVHQPNGLGDRVHHPDNAALIKKAYDKVGVDCTVWGTGSNGLDPRPEGKRHQDLMMAFFFEAWSKPID